jgi:apoptosis-inducing factor 2
MAQAYPKLTFKQAKLMQVNKDDTVEVETAEGKKEVMSFHVLVLCTGFSYDKPVKDSKALTLNDRKKSLIEFNQKVTNAKSILIAGAGVVGIELAGELAVKYGTDKSKKIGLCAKGQRLLPGLPQKASRLADEFLRRHNVEILYNTPFTGTTGKEKGYEVVIECTGYKYHTDFMKKHFSEALAPNGQIYVNDLNQISGTDPRVNPIAQGLKGNIFAFGDCTQTSLNENKGAMSMNFMMPYIINNLR